MTNFSHNRPVYWGSLAHQRSYSHKLNCYFVNRDGSDIGNAFQQVIEANIATKSQAKLGWQVVDPSAYPTDDAVKHAVRDEKAWLALVGMFWVAAPSYPVSHSFDLSALVEAGSTETLQQSRINGNDTYNGIYVIKVYYAQARNEIAAANFLVPITESLLLQTIANFSVASAGEFLTTYGENATVMANVAKAPQTLAAPVGFQMVNLIPFTAPVATAVLFVGSIYIIIFAFIISSHIQHPVIGYDTPSSDRRAGYLLGTQTLTGYAVRESLEPFLTTAALVELGIIAPLAIYIPLSLSYSMISLAFKVPFQAKWVTSFIFQQYL